MHPTQFSRAAAALFVPLCMALAGCSLALDDIKPPAYVPVSAPSPSAQIQGVKKAAEQEKISGPVEISTVRESDRGLARYMVCFRGRADTGPVRYYAAFFDNDDYKGVRISVIYDFCEQDSFRPLD